jgi:hypothetical protein
MPVVNHTLSVHPRQRTIELFSRRAPSNVSAKKGPIALTVCASLYVGIANVLADQNDQDRAAALEADGSRWWIGKAVTKVG